VVLGWVGSGVLVDLLGLGWFGSGWLGGICSGRQEWVGMWVYGLGLSDEGRTHLFDSLTSTPHHLPPIKHTQGTSTPTSSATTSGGSSGGTSIRSSSSSSSSSSSTRSLSCL
jgi:hypothetical protein